MDSEDDTTTGTGGKQSDPGSGSTNKLTGGKSRRGPRRGAGGLRGLDAVPPTPPSNTNTSGVFVPAVVPAPADHEVPDDDGSQHASIVASKQAAIDDEPAPKPKRAAGPASSGDSEAEEEPADANTGGHTDTASPVQQWGVADLVGEIDPEKDLYQSGIRLPRYVMEAIRLYATLTRRSQQTITAEGAKSVVPPQLLDDTYRRLYGRERPPR